MFLLGLGAADAATVQHRLADRGQPPAIAEHDVVSAALAARAIAALRQLGIATRRGKIVITNNEAAPRLGQIPAHDRARNDHQLARTGLARPSAVRGDESQRSARRPRRRCNEQNGATAPDPHHARGFSRLRRTCTAGPAQRSLQARSNRDNARPARRLHTRVGSDNSL